MATKIISTETDFGAVIICAGISGIGAAHHLKTQRPTTSFAILEGPAPHILRREGVSLLRADEAVFNAMWRCSSRWCRP